MYNYLECMNLQEHIERKDYKSYGLVCIPSSSTRRFGRNKTIPFLSVRRLQRYVSLFEILCWLK